MTALRIFGVCRSGNGTASLRPGWILTRWVLVLSVLACCANSALATGGLFKKPDPMGPTSNAAAKANAIRAIPMDRLSPEARAKVEFVLGDTAMFRRMPIRVVPCDPDMYLFLVRHPDVVVSIWDVLELSKLTMRQTGPTTFEMQDNAGTEGTLEFLYQDADTHVLYSEGNYRGPVIKKGIMGRSIIVLKTGYVREPDGRYYITSRLDAFVQVDNEGLELLAKTLHPLVGKVADLNFTQTVAFVGSLSKTAEVDPDGMRRLAHQLTKVSPDVASRFANLSDQVAVKAASLPQPPLANP